MGKEHTIYIWPDYDYYIQDEEGMCSGSTDDIVDNVDIDLLPRFSIIVPGISEWCERYVLATDFADTTTDPSFDWRRWHRDGLMFAKEIYRQLPRNYNLIYKRPFEDRSGLLEEVDFSKDSVDDVIQSLGPIQDIPDAKPSFKYNVIFTVKKSEHGLADVTFKVGNLECELHIHGLDHLKGVRSWMERITAQKDEVARTIAFNQHNVDSYMIPQRIGQFTQMGQLRVEKYTDRDLFSAYVNRREFVRGLYLSLMGYFGFDIYTPEELQAAKYPQGEDRMKRWQPYNDLHSDIIEWFITDELYYNSPVPSSTADRQVDETVTMWVDYGCCFWDTMGVGSGDEGGLSLDCGDFNMDIPGLKEWIEQWAVPDSDKAGFEDWWKKGWLLAKEVRKRLPANVDLYYMSYDPQRPDAHQDHSSMLPKIIVPFYPNKD